MEDIRNFAYELEQFVQKGEQLLDKMRQGGMMGQNVGWGNGGGSMNYRRGNNGNFGNNGNYGNNNGSWPFDPRIM